ncbi:MAG TPA: cytochrome c biogenesis protein CcsA [Bacteroidales bacterium]|nr:cytochrome c biogenesis protein CcsA [Bacteroidales bacterium]HRZ76262.1 cytochrome c biogenesis protein CcsA [Bacteroidales bacterium]
MGIQYIGEHLLPGQLGHIAINLSFLTAILATVFYFMAQRNGQRMKLARGLFMAHVGLFITAMGILYFMIFQHYFEYRYVWQYSSLDMSAKFIVSCFWAGQEGSFFVWGFWQGLLGMLVLWKARDWEAPVMWIVALAQAIISSMLVGLELGGFSIGGNPFALLRETASPGDAEFFANPNYLGMIQDGNGLNPLLENPWMVIHPPLLFLGYATLLIPFAYAVAGLWTRRYHAWVKEARPWTLVGGLTLATGILLGGAWAYVALTFGGFWAWDPVENASLVPWLTIVAGMHFIIAGRNHNFSHLAGYLFITFAYVMVLYASFLTRSGVLSETSVHSFGDDGLMLQLVGFVVLFFLGSIILFILRYKEMVKKEKENTLSREFWMFIGGMILVLSAFQITFSTSIPVINQIFGTNIAPPIDAVKYYNGWQLPYAVLIALVIGFSQYLNFGENRREGLWKRLSVSLILALGLTLFTSIVFKVTYGGYLVMLFGLFFAMASSVAFLRRIGWKWERSGAMMTHFGFALFLVGVVITFTNEIIISENTSQFDLSQAGSNKENQLLMRGDTVPMGPYMVTYSDRWKKGTRTYFKVDFLKESKGKLEHDFTLEPHINENLRMGNVYEPATANHLDKDVYTFISFADLSPEGAEGGYHPVKEAEMSEGDTVRFPGYLIVMDSLTLEESDTAMGQISIRAFLRAQGEDGTTFGMPVEYHVKGDLVANPLSTHPELPFGLKFERVSDIPGAVFVGFHERQRDFIVLKAILFPYINILWFGALIMLVGFSIAMVRRITKG